MDAKLLDRLSRAEEKIVSAMLNGDGDLAAFDLAWTSLLDDISQASAHGDVNCATLAVADDVVARVSIFADCCLSLSSIPSPSYSTLDPNTQAPSSFHSSSFIPEAYAWLLKNIANPYPSSQFKASLAQRHNLPVSTISSWFANTRRRMGWTALCRDFFHNCRTDALDAAHRVLVEADSDHGLGFEITHALVSMKVVAEELYASTMKSALAGYLDTIVEDTPAEDQIPAGYAMLSDSRRMNCTSATKRSAQSQSRRTLDLTSHNDSTHYPMPDLTHRSSISLRDNPPTGGNEESISPPRPSAGYKRRLSSSQPAHIARSAKRRRLSSSLNACLQCTPTSTADFNNGFHDQPSCTMRGNQDSPRITSPCKRHLSDDPHLVGALKGPRDIAESSVSDPFPRPPSDNEHLIDEWFGANFEALFRLPPPADVAQPDPSKQWEVGLFNDYILHETPRETCIHSVREDQVPSPIDLTVLDNTPQSPDDTSTEMLRPSASASTAPDSGPQGLLLLPDSSESIDWTALFNELLNRTSSDYTFSQPCVNSAFSEIDFSAFHHPQGWSTIAL